jgi:hypothetical protein
MAHTKDARRIPQTFECRPTVEGLQAHDLPDELMIDWGGLPHGAEATIYLASVDADQILAIAGRLYDGRPFTRIDAHTVGFRAFGITYFPIPPGRLPGPNYAGLLSLILPPGLALDHRVKITVRQLTTTYRISRSAGASAASDVKVRQEIGAFQINVTVQSPAELLRTTERSLALFRAVIGTTPSTDRWHPVLRRYLAEIAARIVGLGCDGVEG